ncbi:MAG: substrate-binding domain-containing protein, partial [Puniceicoccales bacterium]
VCTTQYRATMQTMQKMHEKGYRRIAFAFDKSHDARADHNYLAGYLTSQFEIGEAPLVHTNLWNDREGFIERLKEQKPEAIVIGSVITMELFQQAKLRVPKDIAVACPVLHRLDGEVAGVVEDAYHIGEVAVDHLTRMVIRGEKGIPDKVQRIHIEGIWQDGTTLPPAKSRSKKGKSRSRRT